MDLGLFFIRGLKRLADSLELRIVLNRNEGVILHPEDHRGLRFLPTHYGLEHRVSTLIHFQNIDDAELVLDPILIEQLNDVLVAAHAGHPLVVHYDAPTAGVKRKSSLTFVIRMVNASSMEVPQHTQRCSR